ncbi:MAG: hydroxyacid dehydrogenase [Spirochaetes bacterium]|nr:hydroxyacid dehydrogenase [Spirochaetota bacterium]
MGRYRILFLPPPTPQTEQIFTPRVMEALKDLADVACNDGPGQFDEGRLAETIGGFEGCITGWRSPRFSEAVMARADRLKIVLHAAGTVKPYVSPALLTSGVLVTSANEAMARVTAEATLALILSANWKVKEWNAAMGNGSWKTRDATVPGLQGLTAGLVGFGAVTRHLLGLLAPFRLERILVHSSHLREEDAGHYNVRLAGLDDLIASSDVVSLHTSLTPRTRGLMDDRRLSLIRDDALFVNTGRGELVDEEALIRHLRTGRFRAALDVYAEEPLPPSSPLRSLPNVTCLPHLGAATAYCREAMGWDVVENLAEHLQGKRPHGAVDAGAVLRMSDH